MNEEEKKYLELFWDDIPLRETVRRALFANLDGYKIQDIGSATNEQIGAEARAVLRAKEILQSKFNSISQYGSLIPKVDTGNPAV